MAYVGFNPQNIPVPPYYNNPVPQPQPQPVQSTDSGDDQQQTTYPPMPPCPPYPPHPQPPFPPGPPIPPGPHGKIPPDGFLVNYVGLATDTADVIVNNLNRTIKVNVNKQGVDNTFVYKTTVPMATWEIEHNMNKYPAVMLTDYDDNVIGADIRYIDLNKIVVSLSEPICGKAFLN